MRLKDSTDTYGAVSRVIHWLVACLVFIQMIGVFINSLWPGNSLSRLIQPWHTSIGLVLIGVMLLRLTWMLFQKRNRPKHKNQAVRVGHFSIYALLSLVPLSGLLMILGKGYGVRVFGERLLVSGNEYSWSKVFNELHGPLAWLMTALISGHVVMVIYHHYFLRDDTLRRMV